MRYYEITITPKNSKPVTFTTLTPFGTYNGSSLKVELDVFQNWYAQPTQNAYIKISGVDFQTINQSASFNGATIQVMAGMSKGLPFANPAQQGMILLGTVFQCFANWQGTEVTLDLVVIPLIGSPDLPQNLTGTWAKGQKLEDAVKAVLKAAYKDVPITGSFNAKLVSPEDQPLYYQDLVQFSEYVRVASQSIIKQSDYQGAQIGYTPTGFVLTDGTTSKTPFKISFFDIIGNATWIDIATIQIKLVMRGDLSIGEYIQLPVGLPALNIVNNYSQYRNTVSFQGVFQIKQIHHVGNSRQPDANAWVSVVDAYIPYVQSDQQGATQ